MGFLKKLLDNLEEREIKNSRTYKSVNGDYFPNIYLPEVRFDITFLRAGLDNPDRVDNDIFQSVLELKKEKYRKEYCSSTLYRYFSFENQFEYCCLRVEIDELLKRYKLREEHEIRRGA